ncbi:voltage-dependent calcium channel beta subunit-associated regulatory protein [Sardina pilchardus]|uniref:voltage-dependent calcium channel beta subunit-associated regulatory protein n=1 Tax=Sardina pilchardus TaxID=27697 RepID=UPI002E0E77F1
MSNESTVWKNLTENPTDFPLETGKQDGYVLLLVLLSIFFGGTLVLLSVLLIVCRHCCDEDRRHARASDDPDKTKTSYLEESQPVHEITIRVDESDCLSAASSHDMETERFLSTGTTGRRVSFNEAALFDHGKKAQEKGRRYTLTEGDFHHLKNARLTHLHIPPPALKIVTIHECESSENSIAMTTRPASKSSLSIFQQPLVRSPLPQTALTSLHVSPSSALPGDALNSTVDTSFTISVPPAAPSPKLSPRPSVIEVMGSSSRNGGSPRSLGEAGTSSAGTSSANPAQGPVLQFFTKLRRHASLEGASPYFKIKKWKLDSTQRASSLDTRGSPKRRQFQRQRAASESMDQEEHDAHHMDLIQYIAGTKDIVYPRHPQQHHRPVTPRILSPPSTPPPSLGRLEVEVVVEPSCSSGCSLLGASFSELPDEAAAGPGCRRESSEHQALYRDIWTLRASLEQYASSDQSSNNDKDSVRSGDLDSVCSLGARPEKGPLRSYPSQDIGDEIEEDADAEVLSPSPADEVEPRSRGKQDSVDSEKGSDGESGNRKLLQMDSGYASIEAPVRVPEELRLFAGGPSGASQDGSALERRRFFTSSPHRATVCESLESRVLDEQLEEEPSGAMAWSPYGQMFTPRDTQQQSQQQQQPPPSTSSSSSASHPFLHRRDYSIDEKTDALFHEFLRHDPQFDQQESPQRSKHRTCAHLRKQWQRSKQYSDPGQRLASSFDRYRTPLRRGESVSSPMESGYHSTLPRIVSTPDEEVGEGSPGTSDTQKPDAEWPADVREERDDRREVGPSGSSARDKGEETTTTRSEIPASFECAAAATEQSRQAGLPPEQPPDERCSPPPLSLTSSQPPETGYGPQTVTAELTDKLTVNLEERLYTGLRRTRDTSECVVAATHASPDHSPV